MDSKNSKSELFTKAKEWIGLTFKTPTKVIQTENEADGIIIADASFPIKSSINLTDSRIDFSLKIQVRQGRFKYWIYGFTHAANNPDYSGGYLCEDKPACGTMKLEKKDWVQIKKLTDDNIKYLIQDLTKYMSSAKK